MYVRTIINDTDRFHHNRVVYWYFLIYTENDRELCVLLKYMSFLLKSFDKYGK